MLSNNPSDSSRLGTGGDGRTERQTEGGRKRQTGGAEDGEASSSDLLAH